MSTPRRTGIQAIEIPAMRVVGGDVFIRLSDDNSEDIILPSKHFKTAAYFMHRMTNKSWEKDKFGDTATMKIKDPQDPEKEVVIHRFTLHYVTTPKIVEGSEAEKAVSENAEGDLEGGRVHPRADPELRAKDVPNARAFLLEPGVDYVPCCTYEPYLLYASSAVEGKDITQSQYGLYQDHAGCNNETCSIKVPLLHVSDFTANLVQYRGPQPGGYSSTAPHYVSLEHAVMAHRILFSYIAGHSLDFEEIDIAYLCMCLADVVTLAELYDFVPLIAEPLAKDLKRVQGLWTVIAEDTNFYLSLAAKIKDSSIFWQAIRHHAAFACHTCLVVGDTSHLAVADVIEEWYPEHEIRALIEKYRPQLIQKAGEGKPDALFLGRGAPTTRGKAAMFLVKAMYSEWFNNELVANHRQVPSITQCPSCDLVTSYPIYAKLLEAQKQHRFPDKPITIFGEEAIERFANIFAMDRSVAKGYKTRPYTDSGTNKGKIYLEAGDDDRRSHDRSHNEEGKYIKECISDVLRSLTGAIGKALDAEINGEGTGKTKAAKDGGVGYFTHISPFPDDVPWNPNSPWRKWKETEADMEKEWDWALTIQRALEEVEGST